MWLHITDLTCKVDDCSLRTPWHSTGMICVYKHKFDGCIVRHSNGLSCVYKHKFHGCLSDRNYLQALAFADGSLHGSVTYKASKKPASMMIFFCTRPVKRNYATHVAPPGKTSHYLKSAI
jgi:hypothetical protein